MCPFVHQRLALCSHTRNMSRHVLYLAVLLVLSACGSPTSPSSIQSHLDMTTPDLKVNGVTIQPGSTTNVSVGSTVDFQVNFTNNSGQFLHTGILLVRDDGVERLLNCSVTSGDARRAVTAGRHAWPAWN